MVNESQIIPTTEKIIVAVWSDPWGQQGMVMQCPKAWADLDCGPSVFLGDLDIDVSDLAQGVWELRLHVVLREEEPWLAREGDPVLLWALEPRGSSC